MNSRDSYLSKFFMLNALFVLIVFLMQLNKDTLHLQWPFGMKYNVTFNSKEIEVNISIIIIIVTIEYITIVTIIITILLRFINLTFE